MIDRLFRAITSVQERFFAIEHRSQVNRRKRFVFKHIFDPTMTLWVRINQFMEHR